MASKTALLCLAICAAVATSLAAYQRTDNLDSEVAKLSEHAKAIIALTERLSENERDTALLRFIVNKYHFYAQNIFYNYNLAISSTRDGKARELITKLATLAEKCTYGLGKRVNDDAATLKKAVLDTFECYSGLIDKQLKPIDDLLKNDELRQSTRSYVRMAFDFAFYDLYMVYEYLSHQNKTTREIFDEAAESFKKSHELILRLPVENTTEIEDFKLFMQFALHFSELVLSRIDSWLFTYQGQNSSVSPIRDVPSNIRSYIGELRQHLRRNVTIPELYASKKEFYSKTAAELLKCLAVSNEGVEYWKDISREVFLDTLFILNASNKAIEILIKK